MFFQGFTIINGTTLSNSAEESRINVPITN